ncbi:hypothetical protein [Metabacillus arenae]|uniref:Uncharacterized protein n=1 Tax=Metabacillus arenae TaxID=2771434 RepID=A0A926RVS3_9BACI|nr:hypothetical protein [Metabacillus arenae]MBD1379201.1 hypothetical protein [Metabacillus arenae]
MSDEMPNVLIVPYNESPEEIIEDYAEMIKYNLKHGVPLEEILHDFFDEVNRWTAKQFLIDQAKECLQGLENIHKIETDFIDDELDDF